MKVLRTILMTLMLAGSVFAEQFFTPAAFRFPVVTATTDSDFIQVFNDSFSLDYFNGREDCSKYLGKGYCTDWIQQRLGVRQRGDAKNWRGNIRTDEGRAGDVGVQLIGRFGHVFVIEGPSYKPYTAILNGYVVSEMNFGSRMVNAPCGVTNLFGVQTRRIIPLNQVARIWRP